MGEQDLFRDMYTTAYIKHTGLTTWIPGGTFSTSCDNRGLDLTYFPFDQHVCRFSFFFQSMSNEIKIVENSGARDTIILSNGEWLVLDLYIYAVNLSFPDIPAIYSVRFKQSSA